MPWESTSTNEGREPTSWNAAHEISYARPIAAREAKAMEVFADALTICGKLAADGMCAEPGVFHHLVGGGMFMIKCESVGAAFELLALDGVRRMLEEAVFTVEDFDVEIMVTGGQLMSDMSLCAAVGTELVYI